MAITVVETRVTWPTAADTKVVAEASSETSEEMNINQATIDAWLVIKADNANATPSTDASLTIKILYGGSDPDNAGGNDLQTSGHGRILTTLDTNIEDPVVVYVPIGIVPKTFKLEAINNAAGASDDITVSALLIEKRG